MAALDGLRAVAVTIVVLCHTTPTHLLGGWIGVDIFFVISGYLITTLLMREHDLNGRIDLPRFWLRRAVRLYPALILMVLCVVPFAPMFGNRHTAEGYLLTVGVVLTYMSDVAMMLTGTTLGGFVHTWSLAVEEHFYMLWPPILVLTLRRSISPLKVALAGSSVGLVAVLLLVRSSNGKAPVAHFVPYTRFYEPLAGCALALWLLRRPPPSKRRSSWIFWTCVSGLFSTYLWICFFPSADVRHLEIAVAGMFSVGLVGSLVSTTDLLGGKFLSRSFMVWIGRISYGIYLFHLPVMNLLQIYVTTDPWLLPCLTLGITVTLADLSFRFMEARLLGFGWGTVRDTSDTSCKSVDGGATASPHTQGIGCPVSQQVHSTTAPGTAEDSLRRRNYA